jgi:2-keto-3-deoxy-L-rhamnonate aldolase RhmA
MADPYLVEVSAGTGFDWLPIDGERTAPMPVPALAPVFAAGCS